MAAFNITRDREFHCIHTPKVYDWIQHTSSIHLYTLIQHDLLTDHITSDLYIPSSETTLLWEAADLYSVSGTITIQYEQGSGKELEVIVNDSIVATLSRGSTFCQTIAELKSVKVHYHGALDYCIGSFAVKLHDPFEQKEPINVQCYLADSNGHPVNPLAPGSIRFKEIPQSGGRKNIDIFLPKGGMGTLQKVKVLIEGFVCVQMLDSNGNIRKSYLLPFFIDEKLFLCSPRGTRLELDLTDFHCDTFISPSDPEKSSYRIDVYLDLCQSIHVTAEVKVELEGKLCQPRSKIHSPSCPKRSPEPGCRLF